jgi:hypothetical protein
VDSQIFGCTRCGWVARTDLFEVGEPSCLECGGPIQAMELDYARHLVQARRRADERRRAASKAAEVGLGRFEPGGDG